MTDYDWMLLLLLIAAVGFLGAINPRLAFIGVGMVATLQAVEMWLAP